MQNPIDSGALCKKIATVTSRPTWFADPFSLTKVVKKLLTEKGRAHCDSLSDGVNTESDSSHVDELAGMQVNMPILKASFLVNKRLFPFFLEGLSVATVVVVAFVDFQHFIKDEHHDEATKCAKSVPTQTRERY